MNSVGFVETLWGDIKHATRVFGRDRGFTTVAVLTLTLGIGGVTIVCSVIRSIVLDPFPYTDSRRMVNVLVHDTATGDVRGRLRMTELLDFVEQSDVFDGAIGTVSGRPMTMPTREGSEVLSVCRVTPNTFAFLGVPALIGRGVTEADGQDDTRIAVVSHQAWVTHYGADPDVVGRPITLDDEVRTIVGVMPPRFTWHVADVWVPTRLSRTGADAETPAFWLQARLKRGVTIAQAEARLNTIATRRAQQFPDEYPTEFRVGVITVIDYVVGRFRGVLYTLFAAVTLLLLIACCNLRTCASPGAPRASGS